MVKFSEKFDEALKNSQKLEEKNVIKAKNHIEKNIKRKLETAGLNESQIAFCMSESKNIRLLAPAGSGKTSSLLWRCKAILESKPKDRFLIFTFTRTARDELLVRLREPEFSEITDNVRITTLNQWGNRYLRGSLGPLKFLNRTNFYEIMAYDFSHIFRGSSEQSKDFYTKSTRKRQRYIDMMEIFEAMKNCGFRHDLSKKELSNKFNSQVNWLENNGLGRYFDKAIKNELEKFGFIDFKKNSINPFNKFLKIWRETCDHLWKSAKITFNDQKYFSLIKFEEYKKQKSFPSSNRYQHILVDEFQDISPLDMFLIRTLVDVHESSLTILGDDDQAIFEWRGASPYFILKPEDYFDRAFETYVLNVNYRSTKNIVAYSQKLIKHNEKRVEKHVKSNVTQDAEVLVKRFHSHNECVDYVLSLAEKANENGESNQLGIIGRKKAQLIPMQIVLTSKDIPFFARQDLNVLFSKAFQDLKEILEIVSTENLGSTPHVVNSFLKLLDYIELYPLPKKTRDKFYYTLSVRNVSNIEDLLRYIKLLDLSSKKKETYREAILAVLPNGRGVSDVINSIGENFAGLKKHYPKSEEEDDIFYKEPPFLYLADYASRYKKEFAHFIEHLDKAILNMLHPTDDDSVDEDINNSVHLMTAFGAKGREYETTVLLDVNDGVFPIKQAETDDEKEAERRIFYVAVTRARRKMILITVDTILGRQVVPSPYIKEMGLEIPDELHL